MKPTIGRADALRIMMELPSSAWSDALALLGYRLAAEAAEPLPISKESDSSSSSRGRATLAGEVLVSDVNDLPLLSPSGYKIQRLEPMSGARLAPASPPEYVPVPIDPLFRVEISAGVVTTLVRTLPSPGPLDFARLIERIARRQPLNPLPRRTYDRLPSRVVVLSDADPPMIFLDEDLASLTDELRRIIPEDAVIELPFTGGLRHAPDGLGSFAPGDTVIVTTDLGIALNSFPDRRDPSAWADLVGHIKAEGGQPVALVPYPAPRWPDWATDLLPVVYWDRPTSLVDIRNAHRRSRLR